MSMETDLYAELAALCPRVFPDIAPEATARPYITWQELGGRPLRMLAGDAGDKRHTFLQVNVWDESRAGALTLIRSIEDTLCASASFTVRPESEPMSFFEEGEPNLYGSMQRFSVYALR